MTDTSMLERALVGPDTESSGSPFSWSAAIAGAFAATAVTFLVVTLGSGIGLSLAWPSWSSPSATALTLGAAVWLVMAQTFGFATGGYLSSRLRSPAYDGVVDETTFRDAAQGLMVWAIGVVATAALAASLALFSAGATAHVAAAVAGAASGGRSDGSNSATTPTDYFVDLMFRPRSGETPAGGPSPGASDDRTVGVGGSPGATPTLDAELRAEVTRVIVRGITQNGLDDNDRAYLAQVVSARAGLARDEAERRVAEVDGKAREAVKQAADTAAKAGAMLSFWTFMSLLFGGAAATLAGILGGQLRDADGRMVAEID